MTTINLEGYFQLFFSENTLCLKKLPTLASCSFGKHRRILIILGKRHQHTFRHVFVPVRSGVLWNTTSEWYINQTSL